MDFQQRRIVDTDDEKDVNVVMEAKKVLKPAFDLVHPTVAQQEETIKKEVEIKKQELQKISQTRYTLYTAAVYGLGMLLLFFWRYKSYFFTSAKTVL